MISSFFRYAFNTIFILWFFASSVDVCFCRFVMTKCISILSFKSFKISSFFFLSDRINNLNKAFDIVCSLSDLTLISIDKMKKYWETRINRRLNFSMLTIVSLICLIMSVVSKWSMNITTKNVLNDSIKWRTFLIIQTTSITFSFVDQ